MRISCPVCQEVVRNEFSCAPCGHVFHHHCLYHWLDLKKPSSCPQCRRACPLTQIIRLYVEEHVDVEIDPTLNSDELKTSLHNALQSVKARDEDIRELHEEIEQLNDRHEKLSMDRQADQIEISDLRKQTHKLRKAADHADVMQHKTHALQEDIRSLKVQLRAAESMSTVLDGTSEEVATVVRTYGNCENSTEALAKFLVSTKKEFESLKSRHKEACNMKDRLAKQMAVEKAKAYEHQRKLKETEAVRESLENELRSVEVENESLTGRLDELFKKQQAPASGEGKPVTKRKRAVLVPSQSPPARSQFRTLSDDDDEFSPPRKLSSRQSAPGAHRRPSETSSIGPDDSPIDSRPRHTAARTSASRYVDPDVQRHGPADELRLPIRPTDSAASSIRGLLLQPQTSAQMATMRKGYNGMGGQSKFLLHRSNKDQSRKQAMTIGQKLFAQSKVRSSQPDLSGPGKRAFGSASAGMFVASHKENAPPFPNLANPK